MKRTIQWAAVATLGVTALVISGCASKCCMTTSHVTSIPYGSVNGQSVTLYTLRNAKGAEATIMNYGGLVQSLRVSDRNGHFDDVVLGYDNLAGYLKDTPYFGAIIGRYGNRIGGAKFSLDGKTYSLAANNGRNSLHGGIKGFDKVVWDVIKATGNSLELHYLSQDGEEGFPGNLEVTATYTLTDANELKLAFRATTDQPTVVNLTHHSYFNLRGQGNGDILGHEVYLNSDQITEIDSELIPTGAFMDVTGTPFDFRTPTAIGARINDSNPILQYGPGYDDNWIIKKPLGQFGLMARVYEPTTGRVMEVLSDEPGLQFYAGNFLDGSITGKGGKTYQRRTAFCMEPQHYPDSPNKPGFPSVVLRPGQTFHNTIVYRFSTR
ncbi:MAG: galactose mutarotase [Verrucomicrobiae bacterium]|nr:galactose mutarotase [Verrucomicrobiae bacterium]